MHTIAMKQVHWLIIAALWAEASEIKQIHLIYRAQGNCNLCKKSVVLCSDRRKEQGRVAKCALVTSVWHSAGIR